MFNHRRARTATQVGALAFLLQGCNLNGQTPKTTLSNGEVLEQDMADASISTRTLQPLAVTSAKIAVGAVLATNMDPAMALSVASGTFTGAVSVGTALTVGSTLTEAGAATFNGGVTVASAFTVGSVATAQTSTFYGLMVDSATSVATNGTPIGDSHTFTVAPPGATTANYYGAYFYAPVTTAQVIPSVVGSESYVNNTTSGTLTTSYGSQSLLQNSATGTITTGVAAANIVENTNSGSMVTAYGTQGQVLNSSTGPITTGIGVIGQILNTSTATITAGYALYGGLTNSGGGAVTTYHGLHLADPGTGIAANQYNIYSAGNVYNYIGGRLGVKQATPAYEIDVTGDINATGCLRSSAGVASGVCVSDRRLKSDITDYNVGLDELVKLQPKAYRLNGLAGTVKGQEEVGFIAQELEKVIPSLVVTRKVKLHESDTQETEIKAVNYTRLPWIAYNAVRQLYAKWAADHETLGRQGEQLAAMKKTVELENLALKAENQRLKDRLDKIELALAQAAPAKALPKNGRKLASK